MNNRGLFKKGDVRIIVGIVLAVVLVAAAQQIYKSWSLKDSKETYAIFVGYKGGVGNANEFFSYRNEKGETIEFSFDFDEKIELGDTVWISHSVADNTVAKVIDTDYKKYLKSK